MARPSTCFHRGLDRAGPELGVGEMRPPGSMAPSVTSGDVCVLSLP